MTLQSLEGMIRTRGPLPRWLTRMPGKLVLTVSRGPHPGGFSTAWGSSWHGSWLPPEKGIHKEQGIVTMSLWLSLRSHYFCTSLLQCSIGKIDQPYAKWDGITQGHGYTREDRIVAGHLEDWLSYFNLGFNKKVCPVPLVMSALMGHRECWYTFMHACWGPITLKFLGFYLQNFHRLFRFWPRSENALPFWM